MENESADADSPAKSRRHFLAGGLGVAAVAAVGAIDTASPAGGDPSGGWPAPQVSVLTANQTSIAFPSDTADQVEFSTTASGGTLAVQVPSGSPVDGQRLTFRITSTPSPTGSAPPAYAWNSVFRGGIYSALPLAPSGGGLTDYLFFIWRSAPGTWDLVANVAGFQ